MPVDPLSFATTLATPGVVGTLVVVRAPDARPTPAHLRATATDALDRALGASVDEVAHRYLGSLPDTVTEVAAIGLAVRAATEAGGRWVHVGTASGASRWTYCIAHVSSASVSIHGSTSAEASPAAGLVVDAGVPASVAATLRSAYHAARGVVEPSRIKALVIGHLVREGGRGVNDGCYLLPAVSVATTGVLAGLCDLGGYAEVLPVADPAQISRLAAPVARSIAEQIDDVVAATGAFVARAAEIAQPSSTSALRPSSGETVRGQIDEARRAAAIWRDRLSLASLDVDAQLDALRLAADAADTAGLTATRERADAARAQRDGGARLAAE